MVMKCVGISSLFEKEYSLSSTPLPKESGKKGYIVKLPDNGISQLSGKTEKSSDRLLSLNSRQIKNLLSTLFKAQGKNLDAKFYENIQLIIPGSDKQTINLFLIKHKLARKSDDEDEIILKRLSSRQIKANIKLTKMERGEYDLSAASSAMMKYIAQIEEKEMGHKKHKEVLTKKIAKEKAKIQKQRTGRAAPDSFHAALKKRATNTTTAMASKDCLLTLDSCKAGGINRQNKKKKNIKMILKFVKFVKSIKIAS